MIVGTRRDQVNWEMTLRMNKRIEGKTQYKLKTDVCWLLIGMRVACAQW